jgi:3-methyladenine DNA glycosylase/8-oxoguanine DNA glycosylase
MPRGENHKRLEILLHKERDADLIDWIDGLRARGTDVSALVRNALISTMNGSPVEASAGSILETLVASLIQMQRESIEANYALNERVVQAMEKRQEITVIPMPMPEDLKKADGQRVM